MTTADVARRSAHRSAIGDTAAVDIRADDERRTRARPGSTLTRSSASSTRPIPHCQTPPQCYPTCHTRARCSATWSTICTVRGGNCWTIPDAAAATPNGLAPVLDDAAPPSSGRSAGYADDLVQAVRVLIRTRHSTGSIMNLKSVSGRPNPGLLDDRWRDLKVLGEAVLTKDRMELPEY